MNALIKNGNSEHPDDVDTVVVGKRLFYLQARHSIEYIHDPCTSKEFLTDLVKRGVDLYTFVQRSFLRPAREYPFPREDESISLLSLNSFDDWWKRQVRKDERNMVRKAEKKGIVVRSAEVDEDFTRSAQKIYNETPVRQGRRYTGYGLSLTAVRDKFEGLNNSEILGAYYNDELVGILWMVYGDSVARIRSFVSLIKHRDKAPNNALMAEGVRRCCEKNFRFIVYEKMGYLPSLDSFKIHNGFRKCVVPRYYVPLSNRGVLAIRLRVHREIQYSLPPRISRALLPMYSLASQAIPLSVWQHLSD